MDVSALAWPTPDPTYGQVRLRPFEAAHEAPDVAMARELATDPYLPAMSTLPADPDEAEALGWVERQRGRLAEGRGFMFAIARAGERDTSLGFLGLWLMELDEGRGNIGFAVRPSARRRGLARDALRAGLAFAWTIPQLHRVEAHIEPWNVGSLRVVESAGFLREGLMRSHQEIGGTRRDMLLYALLRP